MILCSRKLLMRVSAQEVLEGRAAETLLKQRAFRSIQATEVPSLSRTFRHWSTPSSQASWRSSVDPAMTYSLTHVGIPGQLQYNLAGALKFIQSVTTLCQMSKTTAAIYSNML